MKAQSSSPIGIFDSGVGGLTVASAIKNRLPRENILYFGDTVHLPYGNKSRENILQYSLENARFLYNRGAKIIVIACNTSTAIALEKLKQTFPIPVIGVIQPGSEEAVRASKDLNIGIIGTLRTTRTGSYSKTIQQLKAGAKVTEKACPLLVPLIEEDFPNQSIVEAVIQEYLAELSLQVDTLVLGCTHYPLIKTAIKKLYPKLHLVDSANATAKMVEKTLEEAGLVSTTENEALVEIVTNDLNEVFERISHRLFPEEKILVSEIQK